MNEFDPNRLLRNWFKDTREDPDRIPERQAWWFGPDAARDRWLADEYTDSCAAAQAGELDVLTNDPRGRLAVILLLDQLPRNLFRGTPRAFACDAPAVELCVSGHRAGMDQALTAIERVFFWMPLQHVEDLKLQNLGVNLFESLGPADPYRREIWNNFANFARLHRDIIAEFGRFPHRNRILGRESTEEETRYMADGGASFGQ